MEEQKRGPGRPPKYQEVAASGPPVANDAPDDGAAARRQRFFKEKFNPLGQKMAYADRPGYHRHWFNDWPGRVQEFYEKGYEHVKDANGKNISRVVGTAEGGGPLHAYLMEIPEEWWKEDVKKSEQESLTRLEAIKRTPQKEDGVTAQDSDKFYQGPQGSSIRRDR